MPGIFDKFRSDEAYHRRIIDELGVDPLGVSFEAIHSPTRARVAGRDCVVLGSNNYLGLTFDPEAVEAGERALKARGTGTTGSRAANGSYTCHKNLETRAAEFFGREHALIFSTGYQANVGFLSGIAGKGDVLLIDADSHASIYDGCRLSYATTYRYKHRDAADLERRLKRLPDGANTVVVAEGIYSMLGDRAPLGDIVRVAKKHGAYTMVDEAHSLGVLGATGRGLAQEAGVEDQVDFVAGTFSKSCGAVGGFCASDHEGIEALRVAARPYLFTASLPPSVVASVEANLRRIRRDPALRGQLWANADVLYDGLRRLGFQLGPEKTPIIAVRFPDVETGLRMWKALLDHGVYVNFAMANAIPGAGCLLRCSVCAAHSQDELGRALEAFARARDAASAESAVAVAASS